MFQSDNNPTIEQTTTEGHQSVFAIFPEGVMHHMVFNVIPIFHLAEFTRMNVSIQLNGRNLALTQLLKFTVIEK